MDKFKDCLGRWTCSVDEAIACEWTEACSMAALGTPLGCVGVVVEGDVLEEQCAVCPARETCQKKPRGNWCCFGYWDERTGCGSDKSKCREKEVCELCTKADDGVVAVIEEASSESKRSRRD